MSYFPTPSTDITAAPASGAVSDVHAVPALDGAGVFVRVTLAQVLAWMQGHWPDFRPWPHLSSLLQTPS